MSLPQNNYSFASANFESRDDFDVTKFNAEFTEIQSHINGIRDCFNSDKVSIEKAIKDGAGNNIQSTYAASLDISGGNLLLKNQLGNVISNPAIPCEQFTYVVDNDMKLQKWANESQSGNLTEDYTNILIKGNISGANLFFNLTKSKTRIIESESNSKLTFTYTSNSIGSITNRWIFYYEGSDGSSELTTIDDLIDLSYSINNLNIELTYNGNSVSKSLRLFWHIPNITNTYIKATNNNTGIGSNLFVAGLTRISKTTIDLIANNVTGINGVDVGCIVDNCNIQLIKSHTTNANCCCYRANSIIRNSTIYIQPYSASESNNYGIKDSNGVSFCRVVSLANFSGGFIAYNNSYSSPIADDSYLCANTLNGGFNRIGTETEIENIGTSILKSLTTDSTACDGTDYIPVSTSTNTSWGRRTLSSLFTYTLNNLSTNYYNKTEINNKNKYFPQFTYVVDSNQALQDWADNKSGNDYTSVLIKRGEWSSYRGIDLTITSTKVVVGEYGSSLHFRAKPSSIDGAFGYQTIMDSADCYMYGVKVFTTADSLPSFVKCCYLSNCMGISNSKGFFRCKHLTFCGADGSNAYGNCEDIVSCKAGNYGGTSGRYYGFVDCLGVRFCEISNDYNNHYYSTSYFSPDVNETYKCANTLNGGWNRS